MLRNIILFPHGLGQLKFGVEKTPRLIRNFIINNEINFYDVNCGSKKKDMYNNLKNLYVMNEKINKPKLNIGGDHSMSIATVADSLNKYDDLKVIWFDAHPDINTKKSSVTNNYHGMGLSFLTGIEKNNEFDFINKLLPLKNLMYIGVREMDPFEEDLINENDINLIKVNDIRDDFENSMFKINNFIGNSKIHISFDVDVMDPSLVYSTGTKVNDGLYLDETIRILDEINDSNLINMDLTELNLFIGDAQDKDFDSFINVRKLIEKYVN